MQFASETDYVLPNYTRIAVDVERPAATLNFSILITQVIAYVFA
jgi:hypothetical protein